MRKILLAALALAMVGCAEKPEQLADPPAQEQTTTQATPQGGGGDTIGIVSPAAGPSSPVYGSDSVRGSGGGGSGVGTAAKSQAKKAAAKASGGNIEEYLDDY